MADIGVVAVEIGNITILMILSYLVLLSWARGRVLLLKPDDKKTQLHNLRICNVIACLFAILFNIFIIANQYSSAIYIDHFILILEIISFNALIWGARIVAHNYFTSLCLIGESFSRLKLLKNSVTLFAIGFSILYWIVYLLPVITNNNNNMVAAGTAVFYYLSIFAFVIAFILYLLKRSLLESLLLVIDSLDETTIKNQNKCIRKINYLMITFLFIGVVMVFDAFWWIQNVVGTQNADQFEFPDLGAIELSAASIGVFAIIIVFVYYSWVTKKQLIRVLKKNGISMIKINPIEEHKSYSTSTSPATPTSDDENTQIKINTTYTPKDLILLHSVLKMSQIQM